MPANRASTADAAGSPRNKSEWDEAGEPSSAEDVLGQLIRELDESSGSRGSASWDEEGEPSTAPTTTALDTALEIHNLRAALEAERAQRLRLEHALAERTSGSPLPESPAPPPPGSAADSIHGLATGRPLCVVPVAFMKRDGSTVATEAFFTVGKGEALDQLFSSLLSQWRRLGLRLQVTVSREGFVLFPLGDPHHRSMRFTSSGAIFLTLSPRELAALGKLPPLVTRRRSKTSSSAPSKA